MDKSSNSDSGLEAAGQAVAVESAEDERVLVFSDLKNNKATVREGRFIAEGPETIKMLLSNPWGIQADTLLLKPGMYDRLRTNIDAAVCSRHVNMQVLTMPAKTMASLVGFKGCRGSLACGRIPPIETRTLAWLREHVLRSDRVPWRVLAVDTSYSTSNLGSMLRSASAFGIDAVLLSKACCDPWYRQCVRVSMGHVFRVPIVRCGGEQTDGLNLAEVLEHLFNSDGLQSFAAVIDEDAPRLSQLRAERDGKASSHEDQEIKHQAKKHKIDGNTDMSLSARWCLVLGNEDVGVSDSVRNAKGMRRVRISMAKGVDSLSINNATAVLLNGFREREPNSVW